MTAIATATDPVRAAWSLLKEERARYEEALDGALAPQDRYLTDLERHTYRAGKQVRPLLLLLAGRMVRPAGWPGELPQKAIQAAVSLEMLHVATLIHDDIVDQASQRRGEASIQAARGVETALLVGDLQFIQAIRVFAASIDAERDLGLIRQVLDIGFQICCGELDEMEATPLASFEELRRRYLRTVDRKTASLFGLSCEVGATLGGGRSRASLLLSQYGRYLGQAFQIMDDLFDLVQTADQAGKPPCADLARRRWTLPIVNAVEELGADHLAARIMAGEPAEADTIASAASDIAGTRGFQDAYGTARLLAIQARAHLEPFPPGPVSDALGSLAQYVVDRGFDR